jgi:hypothetical protein
MTFVAEKEEPVPGDAQNSRHRRFLTIGWQLIACDALRAAVSASSDP